MTYVLFALLCALYVIAFRLNRLRRRDLAIARHVARLVDDYHRQVVEDKQIADKDEVLIKRLYSRINELEARCYRLRRERYSSDSCGNPIVYIHSFGYNGQYNFVEWLN